jgi:aryl-alcohol dehydrogenase-like predicted oxidoreductase
MLLGSGLRTTKLGLGAMGMSAFYFDASSTPAEHEAESLRTLEEAVRLSAPHAAFIDTAFIYGHPSGATNEELIGKAVASLGRDKFFIATKMGIEFDASGIKLDSSPSGIRRQLGISLSRLGVKHIDLYYQHRVDPATPIETVAATMKQLIEEGAIRGYGLSECTPDELRRAHSVHPVAAVQLEYSLSTRGAEKTVIPVCRELGVGVVAYSPLGRGLLSQSFTKRSDLGEGDWCV